MSDKRLTPAEMRWRVHIGLAGAQRMSREFNAYTATLPCDVNMGLKNFTDRHIDKLKELAEVIINNKNDEAPHAPISTIIQRVRDEWGDVIELDEQGLAKPIHDKLLIEFELLDRWVGMMAKYILRRAGRAES